MHSTTSRSILTRSIASLLALTSASFADTSWTGAIGTDFNNAANWDNGAPAGQNARINTIAGNIATISADAGQMNEIFVARGGSPGLLNHSAGTASTAGWMDVGTDGGTGTYNLANFAGTGGTLTGLGLGGGSMTVGGQLYVGGTGYNDNGGTGTVNINTSGTLTLAGDLYVGKKGTGVINMDAGTLNRTGGWSVIGRDAGGNGALNMSGGLVTGANETVIGLDAGSGALNMSGGTYTSGGQMQIGRGGGNGTVTVNGASAILNVNDQLRIGDGGSGTNSVTVSAGTVNVNSWLITSAGNTQGTLTISGTGVLNQGLTDGGSRLEITNPGGTGTGRVNLDGGTLNTNGFNVAGDAAATSIFNFNGGTLKPRANNGGFMGGLDRANVRNGGAVIDTNGFDITIGQALVHSDIDGDAATDGGLTKNGAGTLTLSNANTYTGGTNVNAGTLSLGNATDTLADGGAVNVGGGTLAIGANSDTVGAVTLTSGAITGSTGTLTGSSYDVRSGSVSATLGGSGIALTKSTSGTVILSGANTYTGGTSINAGTAQFARLVSMPASGAVAVNTGSTLAVNLGGTGEWTTGTSGNGTVGGLLAGLGGQSGGTVTWTGAVNLGLDTTNAAGGTQTYSGNIANVGTSLGLTKLGAGTLVLDAANTYSGGTTVSAGRIEANNNTALGSGAVGIAAGASVLLNASSLTIANAFTLNGTTSGGALVSGDLGGGNVNTLSGTITLAADSNIGSWWNDKQLTLSGKITGSANLTFDRANPGGDPVGGKFLISGATNDYTGSTTVNGRSDGVKFGFSGNAILQLGAPNALPTGTTLTLNNANLILNGSNQTLGGLVASTSGTTVDSNGILNFGGEGTDGTVMASQIVNGSATAVTLTVNNATANTFAGVLGGSGTDENNFALTKGVAGTLTLSGANTYTGPTNVTGGTLEISGSINGTSAVSVTSGTLLLSGGSEKVANVATSITNGTLAFADGGAGGFTETLGTLTLSGTSTLDFGSGTTNGNTLFFAGLHPDTVSALNGGTISLKIWNWSFGAGGGVDTPSTNSGLEQDRLLFDMTTGLDSVGLGQISFYTGENSGFLGTGNQISFGGDFEIVPVPEPSTTGLIGAAALLGLVGFRERRRLSERPGQRAIGKRAAAFLGHWLGSSFH